MVDHTKQHANISLCFYRAEKNQKVRIILHLPKNAYFDTMHPYQSKRFFVAIIVLQPVHDIQQMLITVYFVVNDISGRKIAE